MSYFQQKAPVAAFHNSLNNIVSRNDWSYLSNDMIGGRNYRMSGVPSVFWFVCLYVTFVSETVFVSASELSLLSFPNRV